MSGLEIWELAILPFLLNNCETWTEISPKTIDLLDNIQCMFYRCLMATPRACPIPSLLWETGGTMMEHMIAKKKLIFFHHLTNLPMHSLAAKVFSEQPALSYPGLVMECTNLITSYNLPDFKKLSKKQWKNIVNKKIKKKNMFSLLEKIKSYK